MKYILFMYQPFGPSQCYIIENGVMEKLELSSSKVPDIEKELVVYAYKEKAFDIKVQAPAIIISSIRSGIEKREMEVYNNKKIRVEGVK